MNTIIENFKDIILKVKEDVNQTQLEIMINANYNLINLYYRIGKVISTNSNWGNKFVENLAIELHLAYPNMKGFSVRNLKYMKSFYEEYKDDNEFVQLVAQLPWVHNLELIKRIKDKNIRKWYAEQCIEYGWSKNVLIMQIDTNLFQRQVKNIKHNNFKLTMARDSDLANNMMKDPYILDLEGLSNNFKEKELENKILERLKKFLLEFGSGLSFLGNQYKITVDNQDFYIDLLFYHIKLKCYIAIELKIGDFKPEYGSKLAFYLEALDNEIKQDDDNPSIGIILCQSKSNKLVDYTLKYINKPIGVSEYKIFNKMPKELVNKLPTEKEFNMHLDMEE